MPVQLVSKHDDEDTFCEEIIFHGPIDKFLTNVLHVFPNDTDRQKVSRNLSIMS